MNMSFMFSVFNKFFFHHYFITLVFCVKKGKMLAYTIFIAAINLADPIVNKSLEPDCPDTSGLLSPPDTQLTLTQGTGLTLLSHNHVEVTSEQYWELS